MIRTLPPPAARRSVMISVRLATAVGRVASTQGFERAKAGQDHAGVEIVGSDVDSDQRDPPGMILQEVDRGGNLRALRIAADPSLEHGAGGLAGAAELDQLQARVEGAEAA